DIAKSKLNMRVIIGGDFNAEIGGEVGANIPAMPGKQKLQKISEE
ncbi:11034_t:CDS:1, partial [Gigaspora rosea]